MTELLSDPVIDEAVEKVFRRFNPRVLVEQMGIMTVLSISGGRVCLDRNNPESCTFPISRGRAIRVTLNGADLYDVALERTTLSGRWKGLVKMECEVECDCFNVGRVALEMADWRGRVFEGRP